MRIGNVPIRISTARVTAADVAKKAGVSQPTVSLILSKNPKARVAKATRARVLQVAKELGYRPNRLAQGLVHKRSFALGLIVPGFANLLVVRDVMLSPDAVPYTLYLNFDKAQVGLLLLAFGPPVLASRADCGAMLRATLPGVLVLIAALMACALLIGQIRVDFKWPAIFPVWAWSNLLFTCVGEEALFRGLIQRRLQGELAVQASGREIAGLVMAAVVFGLAHYAGGVWSIVLATNAGVGYGWIFWRTNRIEASILTHFLVNTTHILCFTNPARA